MSRSRHARPSAGLPSADRPSSGPLPMTRRDLLRYLGIAGGAAAIAGPLAACGDERSARIVGGAPRAAPPGQVRRGAAPALSSGAAPTAPIADVSQRILVVIEMPGGNDGMSTVVPAGNGRYHDLRSATAIADDQLVWLDDTFAVPTQLGAVADRLGVVHGVGSPTPNLSHFEMMQRWWTGDPSGDRMPSTGFLGRLCDIVDDGSSPAAGVSFGSANSLALRSDRATTLCVPDLSSANVLVGASDDDWLASAYQRAYASMVAESGDDAPMLALARRSGRETLGFLDRAGTLGADARNESYPTSTLGNRLELTARLLAADVGIRVFHVPMDGNFDTHDNHPGTHPGLMDELGTSLGAFLTDLDSQGLTERVLIATTSEFGRRAKDNGSSGLDHGAASVGLLAGAVSPQQYGEPSSLDRLDEEDNLVATTSLDDYYATLAQWLGVPVTDAVGASATPLF
jgi:uncharacterized protein (DUF1501 family)